MFSFYRNLRIAGTILILGNLLIANNYYIGLTGIVLLTMGFTWSIQKMEDLLDKGNENESE